MPKSSKTFLDNPPFRKHPYCHSYNPQINWRGYPTDVKTCPLCQVSTFFKKITCSNFEYKIRISVTCSILFEILTRTGMNCLNLVQTASNRIKLVFTGFDLYDYGNCDCVKGSDVMGMQGLCVLWPKTMGELTVVLLKPWEPWFLRLCYSCE